MGIYYDNNETTHRDNAQSIDDQSAARVLAGIQESNDRFWSFHPASDINGLGGPSGATTDPSVGPSPMVMAPSENSSPKKRSASDLNDRSSTSPSSASRSDNTDQVSKRQRNTEAARRYRQRKVDRVTELEEALAAMTKERDELRLKLARSETETDVFAWYDGEEVLTCFMFDL